MPWPLIARSKGLGLSVESVPQPAYVIMGLLRLTCTIVEASSAYHATIPNSVSSDQGPLFLRCRQMHIWHVLLAPSQCLQRSSSPSTFILLVLLYTNGQRRLSVSVLSLIWPCSLTWASSRSCCVPDRCDRGTIAATVPLYAYHLFTVLTSTQSRPAPTFVLNASHPT